MILAPIVASTLLALPAGGIPPTGCVVTELARYREFTAALPEAPIATFSMDVPTDHGILTLELWRHSNRSDRYRVLVDRGDGSLDPVAPPAVRTYRGTVRGRPDTVVSGSLLSGGFGGIVRLEDGETWVVQPKSDFCPRDAAPAAHLSYAAADAVPDGRGCALGQPGFPEERFMGGPRQEGEGGIAGTTPSQVEIGCETDFEFFQRNNSSVTDTVNDVESILNSVNAVYDRDANVVHEISVIVVRSASTDPYSSTTIDGRLTEFETKWASAPESGIFRDLAHMFSGVNFPGGAIGLAYLDVVCNSIAGQHYGVVESRYTTSLAFRTSLSAHEIGHNWSCTHCDADGNANCNIMCSANGACGGLVGSNLRLNSRAISEIGGRLGSQSCDFARPAPQPLPFVEQFATTAIQTGRWTYNDGCVANALAVGEPSAPNSLQLNSTGANAYDDDEIRSNVVPLSGTVNPTLRYWAWRTGVEAGETLTVEYVTAAQDWVVLNTILSDGVTPAGFVEFSHLIPPGGRHAQSRIRFRVDGNESNDTWYVDDISITDGPPANDECSGAVTLAEGTMPFDTSTATSGTMPIPAGCSTDGATSIVKDVWYRYVPACSGNVTVSTCGSAGFDTRIAVYGGASCPTQSTPVVACNDDGASCASGTSLVRFAAESGATHWIRVGGASAGGTGSLFVVCTPLCIGDLNVDNAVDGVDLGVLLGGWGPGGGETDLNADGSTDGIDLGMLLGRWGPCGS